MYEHLFICQVINHLSTVIFISARNLFIVKIFNVLEVVRLIALIFIRLDNVFNIHGIRDKLVRIKASETEFQHQFQSAGDRDTLQRALILACSHPSEAVAR